MKVYRFVTAEQLWNGESSIPVLNIKLISPWPDEILLLATSNETYVFFLSFEQRDLILPVMTTECWITMETELPSFNGNENI